MYLENNLITNPIFRANSKRFFLEGFLFSNVIYLKER